MRRDVIVVGAGPVGLTAALWLARSDCSVLVLEKEPGTSERSRAPAIWPRTQELLAELEVIERFLEAGISLPVLELRDADRGGVLLRLPIRELSDETAFAQLLILPQSATERLLYEALSARPKAEIAFSAEVTGLSQSDDEVRVTYRSDGGGTKTRAARFVVGCDGAHSTVREELGFSFDGITYAARAALADVALHDAGRWPSPRASTRDVLSIAIRIAESTWRLILPFGAEGTLALEERIDRAVRNHFGGAPHQVLWKSEFRLHRRLSSRFVKGRVALAGDAAHLNSPVGGQGMNAGIQDAAAVAQAISEALALDATAPLERYGARRRSEIQAGVNRFTNVMTRLLLFRGGSLLRPMLRTAGTAVRVPLLRRRLLRRLAMLSR